MDIKEKNSKKILLTKPDGKLSIVIFISVILLIAGITFSMWEINLITNFTIKLLLAMVSYTLSRLLQHF